MLLQVSIPNNNNVYVTPFMGAAWNLTLLTEPFNSQAPPPPPTTEAELRGDLMSEAPNTTRSICPRTRRSSSLNRSRSPIRFRSWATTRRCCSSKATRRPGRRPRREPSTSIRPTTPISSLPCRDFTIKFDMSSPIRWSNPAGTTPALYDPENNPGMQHAVIDTGGSNSNANITILTLNDMSISGPPAFDGSSYASLQSLAGTTAAITANQYVGEQDMDLIISNFADSGTISNSTFQGGPIEVYRRSLDDHRQHGLGSTADTYSWGAFGVHSSHDLVLRGKSGHAVRCQRPRVSSGRARELGIR